MLMWKVSNSGRAESEGKRERGKSDNEEMEPRMPKKEKKRRKDEARKKIRQSTCSYGDDE